MGETSGTVVRALSLGKPLVVSDVGWFSELPDDVALKVAPDEREVEALAAALELLAAGRRARRDGRAAGALAASEHDARRASPSCYAAALEGAAGGDAVPRRGAPRGRATRPPRSASRRRPPRPRARPAARGRAWRVRRRRAARGAAALVRAVPVWAWLDGDRRSSRRSSAALRRAASSRRGSWSTSSSTRSSRRASPPGQLPRPRPADGRLRRRLPGADRARVGALRRRARTRTRRRRRSTRS